jgi:hypothetical protein
LLQENRRKIKPSRLMTFEAVSYGNTRGYQSTPSGRLGNTNKPESRGYTEFYG